MKKVLHKYPFILSSTLFFVFFVIGLSAYSQSNPGIAVTGKVTDEQGQSIPGVNIVIQGTFTGTVTDTAGNYAISVPSEETVLEFTFIGYKESDQAVGARRVINVTMATDISSLSEFVVIGYGVEKRTLMTGSVGQIEQKQIKDIPVPSVDGIIQGQVSGVQVSQNSGTPGGEMSVRIRGVSSIGGSSQPLYIIDGIPVTTGDYAQIGYEGQGVNALTDRSIYIRKYSGLTSRIVNRNGNKFYSCFILPVWIHLCYIVQLMLARGAPSSPKANYDRFSIIGKVSRVYSIALQIFHHYRRNFFSSLSYCYLAYENKSNE